MSSGENIALWMSVEQVGSMPLRLTVPLTYPSLRLASGSK